MKAIKITDLELELNKFGNYLAVNNIKCTDSNRVADVVADYLKDGDRKGLDTETKILLDKISHLEFMLKASDKDMDMKIADKDREIERLKNQIKHLTQYSGCE